MPSRAHRYREWGFRAALVLVLVFPLLAAVAVSGESPRPARVAVAAPAARDGAPSSRLVAELSRISGFEWATGSSESSTPADVVVRIPETFDAPPGSAADRTVVIEPGATAADRADFPALVQGVTNGAARSGADDVLVSVGRARIDLGVASATAAGLRAGADQAEVTFGETLASVNQLMEQAGPMIAGAQTLLDGIRRNTGAVGTIADELDAFAQSVRGMDVTLGDLRDGLRQSRAGLDQADAAVRTTAALRGQLAAVLPPIAEFLRVGNLPEAVRLADQLETLVALGGGQSDQQVTAGLTALRTGADLMSGQLADLSGLLGVPVDGNARLYDVLTLAVNRLRSVNTLLQQGEQTITQVVGQVQQVQGQMPAMQERIATQLAQFKQASAQLSASLDSGIRGLPARQGAARADPVRLADPVTPASPGVSRVVVAELLGSLIIAAAAVWFAGRMRRGGMSRRVVAARCAAALVAGVAVLGLGAAAIIGTSSHFGAVSAMCAVVAAAATALAIALIRLLGRAGIVAMAGVVGAAGIFGTRTGTASGPADPRLVLPSTHAVDGVTAAWSSGFGDALLGPAGVLFAVCAVSTVVVLGAARTEVRTA